MTPEALYTARGEVPPEAIAQNLQALVPTRCRPILRHRLVCLDTFDGRICGAGGRLTAIADGERTQLSWYPRDRRGRLDVHVQEPVGFVWDLPTGPLRADLEPVIAVRRLLPQVEIEGQGTLLDVLDDEGKTVAHIRIEAARARVPGTRGRWHPLPTVLTLGALRGYDAHYRRLLPLVESRPGFERCLAGLQSLALRSIGATPPRDQSRFDVKLDPAVSAHVGAREIHRALLDIMVANETGVRLDLDTEFLHDFRVSLRSARSLLGQLKGVFSADTMTHFAEQFSWLGRVTGPTRDLDVLLLTVRHLHIELTAPDRAVLASCLAKEQRRQHHILIRHLDGARYRALLSDWRTFLNGVDGRDPGLSNADRPLVDVVSGRAWRLYRRVAAQAASIEGEASTDALHDVRIAAKKLRYLMHATRSLYSTDELASLLGALKKLQAVLGDFNDAQVQERRLIECARALAKAAPGRSDALVSIGRLTEQTRDRAERLRPRIVRELERFCASETRLAVRRALKLGRAENSR